jgi:DNA-binding IscR family transcriptional regulator
MKRLTYMVRQASERIMDLSTLGANNRIYAELLRQAMTNLMPDNRAEIRPIPHHSDIASRVSTTRETVARVLNDLARDNVVKRRRNSLVIPDIHRLADMVEEVRGD